jgi:hypothetical protein
MSDGPSTESSIAVRRSIAGTVLLIGLGAVGPSNLHAEASVTKQANVTRLEARDASVSEVLKAVGAKYEIRNRNVADLNKSVTGTYVGSVLEIVSDVLAGYDYVVKSASGKLTVIIYNSSNNPSNTSTARVTTGHTRTQSVAQEKPTITEMPRTVKAPESRTVSGDAGYNSLSNSPTPPTSPATNQAPVASMLSAAARSQIPDGVSASAPTASGPVNMAALTQAATASLQSLVAALNNVPHK